jgi:protein-S-isoprenylcysteine O-methyltransferase Ste14
MAAWRWRNVPVPEAHVISLVAGIVVDLFMPSRLFREAVLGQVLGWPLALAGSLIAVWATLAVGDVDVTRPTGVVIRGPYAYSRNPMYVAWDLIYTGLSVARNTAWPLVILPIVLVWTHLEILREERGLEGRFGAEYRNYASRTRRYI